MINVNTAVYFSGVSGISQIESSILLSGDDGEFLACGGAKGIVDVAVNTGKSALRMSGVGVPVLGGSHCSAGWDCCCSLGSGEGAGPSG